MRREVSSGSDAHGVGDELAHLVAVLLDDPEHGADHPVVQLGQQRSSSSWPARGGEPALEPARRAVLGGLHLPVQHLLHLAPERFGELLAGGVVEHLLLDLLRARDRFGRRAKLLDPAHQQVVELPAQRMAGIRAHLGQRPADAVHDALVDLVVHECRDPPGALLADPLADERRGSARPGRRGCAPAGRAAAGGGRSP